MVSHQCAIKCRAELKTAHGHVRLATDGGVVIAGEAAGGCGEYQGTTGSSLTLSYASGAKARSVFEALSKGGKITTPLQKFFWVESSGMLTDGFGRAWITNDGVIDVKPAGN